ncbi:hypothetical protein MBANPS3_002513 [Mucor bainieri]
MEAVKRVFARTKDDDYKDSLYKELIEDDFADCGMKRFKSSNSDNQAMSMQISFLVSITSAMSEHNLLNSSNAPRKGDVILLPVVQKHLGTNPALLLPMLPTRSCIESDAFQAVMIDGVTEDEMRKIGDSYKQKILVDDSLLQFMIEVSPTMLHIYAQNTKSGSSQNIYDFMHGPLVEQRPEVQILGNYVIPLMQTVFLNTWDDLLITER